MAHASVSSVHEAFKEERLRSEMLGSAIAAAKEMATKSWSEYVGEKQEAVELLRFITGYKSGLDSFVDITSMTPMLQSNKGLEFYSFIQTWVNNNTYSNQAYINNVTQECSRISHSEGNGWSLSVDLGFTPANRKDKIHPRKVVPLISNAMFADARFGRVAVHEAMYDGHAVTPLSVNADPGHTKFRDFQKDASTAQNATVFSCHGGASELLHNLQLAAAAQKFVLRMDDDAVMKEVFQSSLSVVEVKPTTTSKISIAPDQVVVTFNPDEAQISPGLPVYFADAVTDSWLESEHVWWNVSAPFEQVGAVVSVTDDMAVLSFSTPCVPSAANSWEPKLKIPKSRAALESAKAFANAARAFATQKHARLKEAAYHKSQHVGEAVNGEVVVGTLLLDEFVGHIDLQALWEKEQDGQKRFRPQLTIPKSKELTIAPSGKVCIITEQAHGRLVDKSFNLPKIEHGERVVVQFTATGHGWASTEEQCGEFCKMKYNVSIDNDHPAEFMQWRDDCKNNPTGKKQYGTWWESRNGWCPGSVSSGVYFDITDSLKKDSTTHRLTIDLSVLNQNSRSYEPYTNLKGWLQKDESMLNVDMKVFIYSKQVVAAAREFRGRSCSKAHAALQAGSLQPQGGQWPSDEKSINAQWEEPAKDQRSLRDSFDVPSCSIDFEATAPWHLFDADTEAFEQMTWVSVFKKRLVQGASQVHLIHVNRTSLPGTWGQVGLRLRLQRPGEGLDYDHWDRLASIGLVVDRPVPPPVPESESSLWFKPFLTSSVVVMVIIVAAMLHVTINTSKERWNASVSKRDVTTPIKRNAKVHWTSPWSPWQAEKDETYGSLSS